MCRLMSLLAVSVIRISIAAVWLLSPPLLVFLALRQWKSTRRQQPSHWKNALPVIVGATVLADWVLFLVFLFIGQIGGFGTHYVTNPRIWPFLWLSFVLVIGSLLATVGRGKLCLASVLVSALWFGSFIVL